MSHRLSVLAREAGLFVGLGPRMIMTAGLVSSQFLMCGYIKLTSSLCPPRSAPIYSPLPHSSRCPSRNRNSQRSQESIECCISLDVHPPWTFQLSHFMYNLSYDYYFHCNTTASISYQSFFSFLPRTNASLAFTSTPSFSSGDRFHSRKRRQTASASSNSARSSTVISSSKSRPSSCVEIN